MRRLLLLVSLALGGCWKDDPSHCGNRYGDVGCRGRFCSLCVATESGCVEAKPVPECYFPGRGSETTSGSDSSESGGTTNEDTE